MEVKDIVRRVRESAGDISVLQFSNETLTDWINDAIRECVIENSLLQGRAVGSLVIGQADYSLPPDVFKLHSVLIDGRRIDLITRQQWEEINPGEDTTPSGVKGVPNMCYVWAGSLTVWPTPGSVKVLTILYTKLPAAITYDGTDWNPGVPSIPEAFHSRIVSYCLAQVALQDEDHYRYTMLMTEFRTGVVALKDTNTEDNLYPFITVATRDMGEEPLDSHYLY